MLKISCSRAKLVSIFPGKEPNTKYYTFNSEDGPIKITDKSGVLAPLQKGEPYTLDITVVSSQYQNSINYEAVSLSHMNADSAAQAAASARQKAPA